MDPPPETFPFKLPDKPTPVIISDVFSGYFTLCLVLQTDLKTYTLQIHCDFSFPEKFYLKDLKFLKKNESVPKSFQNPKIPYAVSDLEQYSEIILEYYIYDIDLEPIEVPTPTEQSVNKVPQNTAVETARPQTTLYTAPFSKTMTITMFSCIGDECPEQLVYQYESTSLVSSNYAPTETKPQAILCELNELMNEIKRIYHINDVLPVWSRQLCLITACVPAKFEFEYLTRVRVFNQGNQYFGLVFISQDLLVKDLFGEHFVSYFHGSGCYKKNGVDQEVFLICKKAKWPLNPYDNQNKVYDFIWRVCPGATEGKTLNELDIVLDITIRKYRSYL